MKKLSLDDLRGFGLSTADLGELLGLGAERIRQFSLMKTIERGGKDLFPVVGGVQGYLGWLRDETRRSSKTGASANLAHERALEVKQRRAIAAGELVPIEEAKALTERVIGEFVSRLAGVPAQHTRDLDERARLERTFDEIRSSVAEIVEKFGTAYEDIGEDDSSGAADVAGGVGEAKPEIRVDNGQAGTA